MTRAEVNAFVASLKGRRLYAEYTKGEATLVVLASKTKVRTSWRYVESTGKGLFHGHEVDVVRMASLN